MTTEVPPAPTAGQTITAAELGPQHHGWEVSYTLPAWGVRRTLTLSGVSHYTYGSVDYITLSAEDPDPEILSLKYSVEASTQVRLIRRVA